MHQEIDVVNEQPIALAEALEDIDPPQTEPPLILLVNQDSNQELEDVQTEQVQ